MFNETIAHQLYSTFLFGGLGFLFGAYADVFTVWRMVFHSRKWVVFLQDVWMFLSAAVVFFLLSLPMTGGRLRWYLFAGFAIGVVCWGITFGRYAVTFLLRIIGGLRRWKRRLSARFGKYGQKVKDFCEKYTTFFKKHLHSVWKALYNIFDIYVCKF